MSFFMTGELGGPPEGLIAHGTLEGFLLSVGLLVGHEVRGVGKMAVTHVTCKKGVFQVALFIFYWVFQLHVAVFALVVTEDDVALDAVQRELRGCKTTGGETCEQAKRISNENRGIQYEYYATSLSLKCLHEVFL